MFMTNPLNGGMNDNSFMMSLMLNQMSMNQTGFGYNSGGYSMGYSRMGERSPAYDGYGNQFYGPSVPAPLYPRERMNNTPYYQF